MAINITTTCVFGGAGGAPRCSLLTAGSSSWESATRTAAGFAWPMSKNALPSGRGTSAALNSAIPP